MMDSGIVASIVAGDPRGLAQAYDRHAVPLLAYCRSQVREPTVAAGVTADTFRIAAYRLAGLREPGRLRSWLYAVARVRCLHLIDSGEASSAASAPPEEPAPLHALLRTAAGGLGRGERDVVLLTLWQGLDTGETAAVLGVSRRRANSLLARARGQLGDCLGTLLVARTGRQDCQALDALLAGWNGQFTEAARKRVGQHTASCAVCAARRRRELGPALLGQGPGTALTAVVAEAARTVSVPSWLREAALPPAAGGTATGTVPGQPAKFRKDGFPRPAARPRSWTRPTSLVPAIAATAAAITRKRPALPASSWAAAPSRPANRSLPQAPQGHRSQ
jgi:DNA-directed RNA polymerase specialized sigma24 family protein